MRVWQVARALAVVAAAALGAAGLAGGAARQTTNPYEQSIGSATIDIVSSGKAFDLRGETLQRDAPKKLTLTLVRLADGGTTDLQSAVVSARTANVSVKLLKGGTLSLKNVHIVSDSVGTLGAVNGANLEQVVIR